MKNRVLWYDEEIVSELRSCAAVYGLAARLVPDDLAKAAADRVEMAARDLAAREVELQAIRARAEKAEARLLGAKQEIAKLKSNPFYVRPFSSGRFYPHLSPTLDYRVRAETAEAQFVAAQQEIDKLRSGEAFQAFAADNRAWAERARVAENSLRTVQSEYARAMDRIKRAQQALSIAPELVEDSESADAGEG